MQEVRILQAVARSDTGALGGGFRVGGVLEDDKSFHEAGDEDCTLRPLRS